MDGLPDENRRWLLARRPEGQPTRDDFELETAPISKPGPGEVLLRTLSFSVDPYMRGRMRDRESYAEPWPLDDPMRARAVGEVVDSNHPDYEVGDVASGMLYWAEYATADGDALTPVDPEIAPPSTALGILGMPGRTAYFGTLDVAEPRPGDTMVVSAAAGAVGSAAAQIGSLAGARVIGIAGSDEKTAFLTENCGIDAAINYREEDVPDALDRLTDGVDVYFDNVGGEITDAVVSRLNVDARVAVCGQIAHYNAEEEPTGPRAFPKLIASRARVQGFLVGDYSARYQQATERLAEWVNEGSLVYRETTTEGIENAPDAFAALFGGEKIGKQIVQVSERSSQ